MFNRLKYIKLYENEIYLNLKGMTVHITTANVK